MKRINFVATELDERNIETGMKLYPFPTNTTQMIRLALAAYIRNADPVQLEAARKQARKATKEAQR